MAPVEAAKPARSDPRPDGTARKMGLTGGPIQCRQSAALEYIAPQFVHLRFHGAGSLRGNWERLQPPVWSPANKRYKQMKAIKSFVAVACALAFMASVSVARAESCCDKAKAAGKTCEHKCCVKAAKDGKSCEKCNPKKEEAK